MKFGPKAFAAATAVGSLLAGAGAIAWAQSNDVRAVEGEPAGARPVSPATPIASGVANSGDRWEAVRYRTADGRNCIDIRVTGPSVDGRTQTAGGCFDADPTGTQRGRAMVANGSYTIAFGVLERGASAPQRSNRGLQVAFNSGETDNNPVVTTDGLFVSRGRGLPTTLTYRSSNGAAWSHAWADDSPRS